MCNCLLLGGDTVDEDGQNTLPRVQIVARNTVGTQDVEQQAAKVLVKANQN